jgi:hypothetical protein
MLSDLYRKKVFKIRLRAGVSPVTFLPTLSAQFDLVVTTASFFIFKLCTNDNQISKKMHNPIKQLCRS